MDALWNNLPPVTKGWSVACVATSTLITINRLKLMNLLFIPSKIYSQNQTWRLITSFITFGDLSFELVYRLWAISTSCGEIESLFQTKFTQFPLYIVDALSTEQLEILRQLIDRNRSIDFLYYVMQICFSIIVGATILFYKISLITPQLGLVLIQVFQYYSSKLNPLEMVNFFGFRFRNMYQPYLLAFVNLLISDTGAGQNNEPTQNGNGNNWNFGLRSFWNVFRNPMIWFYVMSFGLGHFWWCSREVILGSVHYNDDGDATHLEADSRDGRIKKRKLLKQNGIWKFDLVKEALVILLLPPWYWIMLSKIKQQHPHDVRRPRHAPPELQQPVVEEMRENLEQVDERAEEQVIRHLDQVE
ncbi:Der1-like family protein [Candida parapsilosis]|uniref:Derlin n=2 Tax=Candida parapsilosis TaxID=5480 RepID=G8B9J4_CANPC|nr:uncharacterized protein CPAR2_302830 [Candida parapsilosis]KAF6044230.1 Der1-like family protein [Candida parapsilosis]KAF6047790.1 Der1-like family protein [Candida parapsilosis]KAF6050242.1 Der1-like family protein [Candida parapsilosis]KAF6061362.1 Der1-like family protein [Candida parapsilosis]KAI5904235.1 Derlin-2 [Candida parapsilosis]